MGLSPGELHHTLIDLIRRSRLPIPDLARDANVDEAQLGAFLQTPTPDQLEFQPLIAKLNDWTVAYFQKFSLRSPLISSQSIPLPMPSEKKPVLSNKPKSPEEDADNAALMRISNVLKQIRTKGMLCPTRIDESFKTMRYQDEFIWDINNPGLTPETFTILLLKDVGLPENVFKEPIKRSILRQTTEFQSVMNTNPKLALEDSLKGLIVIKVDITLNGFRLVDEVYWNPYMFPETVELFATSMCKDYGLTGDWAAKIAFDIRWALLEHRKAVYLNNSSPFARRPITGEVQYAPIRSVYQSYSDDVLQSVVQL